MIEAKTETADPITLELVKNALSAVVDEMAIALMRAAYSTNLKTSLDMSCALCDADGRLIAQGMTLPLHLGSIPAAIKPVIDKFSGDIHPGDIFVLNDPYNGGTHLPDIYIFKPIHFDDRLVGWSITVGHHMDIGGKTPGGNGCDATEIYQEGLRIPPSKLYDSGEPVSALFDLLESNVRVPRLVLGDLRSQIAACLAGEREYLDLISHYGFERFSQCAEALLNQAERLSRDAFADMPDGTYSFTDWLDGDGMDSGPIEISVDITVDGCDMVVDFSRSARQVQGAINSPLSFTKSAVYACVRHLIGGDPPNNEGYFRAIEVRAPEGTIVNPRSPASVAARGLTGFRIANVVFGALSQISPSRVFACEVGGDSGIAVGGYYADGRPFVFVEFIFGSWGGRPDSDGIDACSSAVVNFSNNPIEIVEAENPLTIERYEFVPDSGGAGQFRGGLAIARDYRFEAAEASLQLRTDRHLHRPYGLNGGEPGAPAANVLVDSGGPVTLPAKCTMQVRSGTVLRHVVAGAGGWGSPLLRDPDAVLQDVLDEKVSVQRARAEYGVVVDPQSMTLDLDQTRELRRSASESNSSATPRSAGTSPAVPSAAPKNR